MSGHFPRQNVNPFFRGTYFDLGGVKDPKTPLPLVAKMLRIFNVLPLGIFVFFNWLLTDRLLFTNRINNNIHVWLTVTRNIILYRCAVLFYLQKRQETRHKNIYDFTKHDQLAAYVIILLCLGALYTC